MEPLKQNFGIDELINKIQQIKEQVQIKILSLPDTSPANRINSNCFTILKSQLNSRSWSPEFYDFKAQYKAIAEELDHYEPENIERKLKLMVEKKQFTISRGLNVPYIFLLHDDVVNYLKTIFK
jgi:hypothetical protein